MLQTGNIVRTTLAILVTLQGLPAALAQGFVGYGSFNGRYTSIGSDLGVPEDLILFGINVSPNGQTGTTGIYSQLTRTQGRQ